jgi:protease I
MRKLLIAALVFWILSAGIFISCIKAEGVESMKKVVMILAHENFRDEEFLQPAEILEKRGVEVKVASSKLGPAKGSQGMMVKPDMLLSEVKVNDFDAVIFVGGGGASEYWDDPVAHKLAQDACNLGKVVAAICIAPVTLARAGILKGKKATVWDSEGGQLKALGADYTGKPVEKDGKIITASGPFAAKDFGEEIIKALE